MMQQTPLISVILPTYNRGHCVVDAIESVLCQTVDDLELLIVDDGSTDDTSKRVRLGDRRIRYIRQDNQGAAAARNHGLRLARGRWIGFIDSDDEWLPHKLERHLVDLRRRPQSRVHAVNLQLTFGDRAADLFSLRGCTSLAEQPCFTSRPLRYALRSCFMLQGLLVRRTAIEAAGPFDEHMRLYEDFDFITRLALVGPWSTSPSTAARVLRKDAAQASLSHLRIRKPVQSAVTFCRTYRRLLARPDLAWHERMAVRRRLSAATFDLARQLALADHVALSRRFARQSGRMSRHPRPVLRWALSELLGLRRFATWREPLVAWTRSGQADPDTNKGGLASAAATHR